MTPAEKWTQASAGGRDGPECRDWTEVKKSLRWLLVGLRMSGVREWLRLPEAIARPAQGSSEPAEVEGSPPVLRIDKAEKLRDIREVIGECTRCRLHQSRTHIVYGEGSPEAPLVFVGEGPGAEEDRLARPFVGRAGKLLDKMIQAIGLERSGVYIANVVKCRPPGNRTPLADEIAACSPFLFQQLETIRPVVICALGLCAAQTLLGSTQPMGALRGRLHFWRGIPLIATYHPAYLLRNPVQKANVWKDLLEVKNILGSDVGKEGKGRS